MRNVLLLMLVVLLAVGTTFSLEIVIDAQKDEFYGTLTGPTDGWIYIPYTANNNNNTWAMGDDEYDLSANFWCAWDETYFYFYEEVWDEYVTNSNATNHQNDCLEIKFDPDPTQGEPATTGVFAIRLTALDSSDTDGPLSGVDNMYPEGNSELTGFHYIADEDYARTLTDFGYNVEGRLPWEHIYKDDLARGPVVALAGEIFGMAVMNHENDDTAREGSIEWASHQADDVWNKVTMHGKVTFLEGNKLSLSTENFITEVDTNTNDYTPKSDAVATNPLFAPAAYELSQNYPNPFNPTTTISFSLPVQSMVNLSVYDLLGNQVAELVNEVRDAGVYHITFDGAQLSTGVYFYKLNNGSEILTQKMMLVK
jgi:hypothetical protein